MFDAVTGQPKLAAMRPIFRPALVNDPFGDPGLYVDFKFEKRALLFDLGDLTALPPKKLLRISDVFVSHTHMDHFFGFDRLLRLCLGRHTSLCLYDPPGFTAQVSGTQPTLALPHAHRRTPSATATASARGWASACQTQALQPPPPRADPAVPHSSRTL